MKSKGFTLIEPFIVIAILGVIAAVVALTLNVADFSRPPSNNETATNATVFQQLSLEPVSTLNLTELNFMVDYCIAKYRANFDASLATKYATIANIYQNQILILHEMEGNEP